MEFFSSYAPDESKNAIIQEETWFQGTLLSNVFFGVQSALFVLAFRAVLKRRTSSQNRAGIALLVYISILFAVTTAAQGLLLGWIQMAFITQRNYPGGPSAFLTYEYAITVNIISTVLVVCANWMMESLMVWRCYVVCSAGGNWWRFGIAVPLLLLVAVTISGSLFLHNIAHSAPLPVYVLAYGISSLVLNLMTTGFIAGRLFLYRHRIVSQLGRGHGKHYVSIAAVVVESAAVYTGFLIIVIVAFAMGSPATNLLQQLVEQIQTITSLLIILRIARGEGWDKSTEMQMQSAAVSSLDTHLGPPSRQNTIQLEVLSRRLDEEEEASMTHRKENDSRVSFPKHTAL